MKKHLILALLALGCVGNAREFPLVVNGKTDAAIVFNPRPTAPEYRASVELQEYIKKISGVTVPRSVRPSIFDLIKGNNPAFVEVLLVTTENGKLLMPAAMYAKLSKALTDQAFYIQTVENRIIIGGKDPIGVLYGAYTFIEKYLGVRWFHPGADGEYCPKSPGIAVGEIDDFEEPSINGRYINCWEKSVLPWSMEEVRTWQIRNKIEFRYFNAGSAIREVLDLFECGNSFIEGGGHLTFEQAVPKKLFEIHPEYFPWKNGKRVCEERSQRCLANTDVRKMVVNYVLEMTKYGGRYMISFHDSTFRHGNWCQCPECMKMGTYNGAFTVPNLAHRFTSMIADEVLKRNSDARLSIEIYSEFRDLPTDPAIRYDKRVMGRYAPHQRCYVHRFGDPAIECNTKLFKLLMDWQKVCPKIELFDFYSYANSPYAPKEYILAEDIKLYKRMNLDSWVEDCTNKDLPVMSSNWPFYYVAAKMLWDASLDVDKLMSEVYDKYYGASSEPMKKYQALRRELWEQAPGHALYGGPTRIAYCLTVPGAEKRLKSFLVEADKLAGNDAVLKKRISADRECLEQFWVKEAEKMKKVMSAQNNVPVASLAGKITVDGVLDEEDWKKAQLVSGFLTIAEKGESSVPVEETQVKVLYDKDNWYVAFKAMTEHAWSPVKTGETKHDGEVWNDDSVEVFIMPPNSDYFHWVINSAGTYYDAKARAVDFESKAEVKTKVEKDHYIVEVRIPAESMGMKIDANQVWHMHFCRTCRNLQPPKDTEDSSLDGTPPHEQTLFRLVSFGQDAPMMWNGGFEVANEMKELPKGWVSGNTPALMPAVWCLHDEKATATIVTNDVHSGKNAWKIEKGRVVNYLPTLTGDNLHIEFWAKGTGKLTLMLIQYTKPSNGGSRFIGTDYLAEIDLTPEWKLYEFDHTITRKETQQAGLAFAAGAVMIIDDVAAPKIQRQGGNK